MLKVVRTTTDTTTISSNNWGNLGTTWFLQKTKCGFFVVPKKQPGDLIFQTAQCNHSRVCQSAGGFRGVQICKQQSQFESDTKQKSVVRTQINPTVVQTAVGEDLGPTWSLVSGLNQVLFLPVHPAGPTLIITDWTL